MAKVGAVRDIVNMQLTKTEARLLLATIGEANPKPNTVAAVIEERLITILTPDAA